MESSGARLYGSRWVEFVYCTLSTEASLEIVGFQRTQ
ncbi:uncharacterized protein VDAG_09403 [Verticillium dahliae VdLs.17]|uniref:Uncharacterized protein n=1 Tax=Verticillium dahliae (strain VdLs.17 / ATCC MYA-4575 / FGSC 10137) TaxID=498257 RepID=G2XGX1_VERDV|nr:uncharacterized protein VDAG_09403 [Verticillium dahliae VdLs.17]EGY19069.1 hypothetical protein VDAG_09403 [Verticillium dahliae VdLs.17]